VIEGKDQSESRIGDRDKNLLQRERQYRIKHLRKNKMRNNKNYTDRTGNTTETHRQNR